MTAPDVDLAGIGIGPFNLSLAALAARVPALRSQFLERRAGFAWHPHMLLDGAALQTACLKDLVSAADPTHPCSFTAYLVDRGRFYSFLAADFPAVSRLEFNDYLTWAAARLPNLRFGAPVVAVEPEGPYLRVSLADGDSLLARHAALGTGPQADIPHWARAHLGERVFHALHYLRHRASLQGREVVVVGGGQSGAEIVLDLLRGPCRPSSLTWLTRRAGLEPLDATPFTDHCFTPGYVQAFHAQPAAVRTRLVAAQKLAGDGVSKSTLRALYQTLYLHHHFAGAAPPVHVLPGREAVALGGAGDGYQLLARRRPDGELERHGAQAVVLCTGQRQALAPCAAPLARHIEHGPDGVPLVDERFRLVWRSPRPARVYAQNLGRLSHGIAEPQLSLMAWRSAVIVNDLAGREVFALREAPGFYHPFAAPDAQAPGGALRAGGAA